MPNAPLDWTILHSCEVGNVYTLPDDIRLKVIIVGICERLAKSMCGNLADPFGLPPSQDIGVLIGAREAELDVLEAELAVQSSGTSILF